jgi:Big-like domain-containing protein
MMKFVRRGCYAILVLMFTVAWPALAQLPGGIGQGLLVGVTSPAPGANVSGAVAVRASTTLPVAGVQFRLDGVDLGPEDTAAPYEISWDTTSANNGAHNLTVVARDVLGIRYYSDPVAVTVANAPPPPPPPPPSAGRYEDTDPAVAYTAGWTQGNTGSAWSGGTAATSATQGARVAFTFTGPSVTWIGGRSANTGIARVYIDGAFVADVDTYQGTEEVRVTMFTLSGLAAVTHTLTLEVTGTMNPLSASPLIVVDAFDAPAPAVSRLQETDPDVTYGAGWVPDSALRHWSAGKTAFTAAPGAQATIDFTGTAITWIGARGNQCGIASVFLDGIFVRDVDAYSATEQIQADMFTVAGLADTPHTLSIRSTGAQNPASFGNTVIVDAFEVTSAGIMVQETDPSINYSAGWALNIRDHAYNQGATAESNTFGARATITFTGTGISWIGARGPAGGIARVYLDSAPPVDVDAYAATEGPQHTMFSAKGLPAVSHTLTVEVTGRSPLATDAWILIDAFVIVP